MSRRKYFQAKEHESDSKLGIVFAYLIISFIKSIHKHFFIVLFDKIAGFVVLVESGGEGPELDPIITIFDIF